MSSLKPYMCFTGQVVKLEECKSVRSLQSCHGYAVLLDVVTRRIDETDSARLIEKATGASTIVSSLGQDCVRKLLFATCPGIKLSLARLREPTICRNKRSKRAPKCSRSMSVLVEEFGSMRGLCKMADLHSLFTRCHSLMQALKDSAKPATAIMLPKVCAASVVALLFWGISTSSRFLDDEDTDRFKEMLARRRKLRIKDVQVFQCHWLMATNMIGQGEGGLLSE